MDICPAVEQCLIGLIVVIKRNQGKARRGDYAASKTLILRATMGLTVQYESYDTANMQLYVERKPRLCG